MVDWAAHARALSSALKELHRALLVAEAGNDPALDNPYTMLFAIIGEDPRFKWTAPLSGLIVRIDEQLAEGDIVAQADLAPHRREAERMLGIGDGVDSEFRLRILIALQKDPAVGLAVGRLRETLSAMPAAETGDAS